MVSSVAERISDAVGQASPSMSEKYLAKVIESKGNNLTKEDLTLFNKLGIALRGQGKWREAIDNYTRALDISPDDEGLHYNMGMAYYDGKELKMAAKSFDIALEKNPEFYKHSEGASMNMGGIYMEAKRFDKARIFFTNALTLNPRNTTAKRKLDAIEKATA